MTKTAPARGSPMIRRGPPEISIEWMDVTIDIRVSLRFVRGTPQKHKQTYINTTNHTHNLKHTP